MFKALQWLNFHPVLIRFHSPFKTNEFNDWFLINVGFRAKSSLKGFFIIILNCGIEIYYKK